MLPVQRLETVEHLYYRGSSEESENLRITDDREKGGVA